MAIQKNFAFNCPADAFARVSNYASTESSMEALSCIHVRNKNLEAVNGFSFLSFSSDLVEFSGEQDSVLFAFSTNLIKACQQKDALFLTWENNHLTVISKNGKELYIEPENPVRDWQFPNTEQFHSRITEEKFKPVHTIGFPYHVFETIKKTFGKDAKIKFSFTGEDKPCRFVVQDFPEYVGIIMPLIIEDNWE
jgi:hypothetical protein